MLYRSYFLSIILLLCFSVHARRENMFDYTPSHFIYPIPSKIPGLGSALGLGVTVNNIAGTDLDFTGVHLSGDFDVSVLSFLNFHLINETLVLDGGAFKFNAASVTYDRGADSESDNFILPYVQGEGYFSQLTLLGFNRMFELYVRSKKSTAEIKSIFDQDGNEFSNIDQSTQTANSLDLGFIIDITDHRYDPRKGLRLEYLRKNPSNTNEDISDYYIQDINLSLFVPLGMKSTWAFNYFSSDAVIKNQATTDYNELKSKIGLGCDSIPASMTTEKENCQTIEAKRINQQIAMNKYGRATPLGGSQRLRSFDNGRFSAGHSRFIGSEIRWNFSDEQQPFDLLFIKGVRTGLQLASFGGIGSITDDISDINYNLHSYGIGARIVFKGGTVFRADWAQGNEGSRTTLFVDYPWGLSPLDNSSD